MAPHLVVEVVPRPFQRDGLVRARDPREPGGQVVGGLVDQPGPLVVAEGVGHQDPFVAHHLAGGRDDVAVLPQRQVRGVQHLGRRPAVVGLGLAHLAPRPERPARHRLDDPVAAARREVRRHLRLVQLGPGPDVPTDGEQVPGLHTQPLRGPGEGVVVSCGRGGPRSRRAAGAGLLDPVGQVQQPLGIGGLRGTRDHQGTAVAEVEDGVAEPAYALAHGAEIHHEVVRRGPGQAHVPIAGVAVRLDHDGFQARAESPQGLADRPCLRALDQQRDGAALAP